MFSQLDASRTTLLLTFCAKQKKREHNQRKVFYSNASIILQTEGFSLLLKEASKKNFPFFCSEVENLYCSLLSKQKKDSKPFLNGECPSEKKVLSMLTKFKCWWRNYLTSEHKPFFPSFLLHKRIFSLISSNSRTEMKMMFRQNSLDTPRPPHTHLVFQNNRPKGGYLRWYRMILAYWSFVARFERNKSTFVDFYRISA